MRFPMVVVCGVAAVLLSVACGNDGDIDADNASLVSGLDGPVVRHTEPIGTGGEDALIAGKLVLDGECLSLGPIDGPGEQFPIVWPAQTGWDAESGSVVLPSGTSVDVGETVAGGGGFHGVSSVEGTAGEEAAALVASCLNNAHGEVAIFNNFADAVSQQQ